MLGTTSFDIALAKGTVFSREIPVNTMKQVLLEIKNQMVNLLIQQIVLLMIREI